MVALILCLFYVYFKIVGWKNMKFVAQVYIAVAFAIMVYFVLSLFFAKICLNKEGLLLTWPFFRRRIITWDDLRSLELRIYNEKPRWTIRFFYGYPLCIVWVHRKDGKHIPITNWMNDYNELLERLIEECDRRGLGGKVEYKVREKVWELQDAKREKEEWEEDAWEDEEMEEEWEEEDEASEAPVRKRNR